jgi:hypothetical protein
VNATYRFERSLDLQMIKRHLRIFMAAVFAAFAALAIALLFRSYLVSDAIYFRRGTDASNTRATLLTFSGRVFLDIHQRDEPRLQAAHSTASSGWKYQKNSGVDWPLPKTDHAFLGFGWSHSTNVQNITGYVHEVFQLECPIGTPVLLSLVLAALTLRRSLMAPPGHCPQCGYDLRASVDRCPECGRVKPVQTESGRRVNPIEH